MLRRKDPNALITNKENFMTFWDVVSYFVAPVTAFVFLYTVFTPLERSFPAKPKQKFFRFDWVTDLCFFLGQHLFWIGVVLFLLSYFEQWVDGLIPSDFRDAVAQQPWALQVVEVILLSDFFIYWAHRLQHRVDFLWRFHSVHHTAERLDWLAAFREHPLDTLYTIGIINMPAILLGFPVYTIAGFIAFRGVWAIYLHSNIRIPIGPIRMLIGSPEIHHWHHAKDRDVGNYANLSPLMDIIFGTYVCPDHEPDEFGVKEQSAKNYLGHLIYPFLRGTKFSNASWLNGDVKKDKGEDDI